MSNIYFTEKDGKFTIPIPEEGFTTNDENSEFTDGFFVSWTYPLSLFMTAELKRNLGDLSNPTLSGGKFKVVGFISKFGEIFPAKMKITPVKKSEAKMNFEFGVASLAVMDKKLSEIDLGTISTPNLYDFVDANLFSSYPASPVCFPRIRTPKDYMKEIGPLYGGTNVYNESGSSNKVYRNEFVVAGQAIYNFIKPIVYVVHILKKGFESSGYILKGDILTDSQFLKVGFDHNNTADEEVLQNIKRFTYNLSLIGIGTYSETYDIIGAYYFSLIVDNDDALFYFKVVNVETNAILYDGYKYPIERDDSTDPVEFIHLLPTFEVITKIRIELTLTTQGNSPTPSGDLYVAFLNPAGASEKKSYVLPSQLQLNKYVPDNSFIEVLKMVKLLGNYNITLQNNIVLMNKIKTSLPELVDDFTFSEQEDVEVSGNEMKGYLLGYEAPEEFGFVDFLYDKTGFVKTELKIESEDYEVREYNAYPLPITIELYRNAVDEVVDKLDGMPMIRYSGTKTTNNADSMIDFSIPNLYENNFKNSFYGRLNASGLKWQFSTKNPLAFKLKSTDCIYAYSAFHKIKNIIKKHHLNGIVEIEIETENRY